MATDTQTADPIAAASAAAIDALVDALRSATSPEMMQAQLILARRLALEGDVFPARVPPPRNITEVGGYLNLLQTLDQPELRAQVLAATLGVAGPNPTPGWLPTSPPLYFAEHLNDRPAGAHQASIPVSFGVRSDFATALDAALKTIHDRGCTLPLQPRPLLLPAANGTPSADDLLTAVGRTLDLVPSAALNDADADPLAVAHLDGTTDPDAVCARQLDAAAPDAAAVIDQAWAAWECTSTTCARSTGMRKLMPLAPILNAAGWYQPTAITAPAKLTSPGNWAQWTNVTGLVAGATRYGDELQLLYTGDQIAASSLRDRMHWIWDGTAFAAPAP
jgi:hypothetical protein